MSAKSVTSKAISLFIALSILTAAALAMPGSSPSLAQTIGPGQSGPVGPGQPGQDEVTQYEVTVEQIAPEPASALARPQPSLSSAEMVKLDQKIEKLREVTAARSNIDTSSAVGEAGLEMEAASASETTISVDETSAVETSVEGPEFHGVPGAFIIGSNVRNPRASLASGSTLAEPAAANEGPNIFYAGNLSHNEFSPDGGINWFNVPVPAGPADAPIQWGDWDVVYDQARGVTFRTGLYLNAAGNNGVVRLFVRRDIPGGPECAFPSYIIDPAGAGNNVVPDYPHINLSNDYLYLTTNNLGPAGAAAARRSQVRRFNIDQLVDCAVAAVTTWDYVWAAGVGQRVFVPVEGARETMYWGMHENVTTMRIFSWPESAAAPSSVLRAVAASSFGVDEDCSGGVGNADWWGNLSASIIGFRLRGAVGHGRIHFYWNAASDAAHTQGHIHGAIFREDTMGTGHAVGILLAQPVIFSNSACYGYPAVSANERGDIGMVLAFGGNLGAVCAGAGCSAAQTAVGIDDDFTAGLGNFALAGPVAAGTHNRADARFGDYFTIHPHEPCDNFFGATAYALNGGTSVANVNARWVEFGRGRDAVCYRMWDDEDPR